MAMRLDFTGRACESVCLAKTAQVSHEAIRRVTFIHRWCWTLPGRVAGLCRGPGFENHAISIGYEFQSTGFTGYTNRLLQILHGKPGKVQGDKADNEMAKVVDGRWGMRDTWAKCISCLPNTVSKYCLGATWIAGSWTRLRPTWPLRKGRLALSTPVGRRLRYRTASSPTMHTGRSRPTGYR